MRTIICTITFRDGERLTAVASSPSPHAEVAVEYNGAVQRLGSHWGTARLAFLEFFLRARALHLRAEYEVSYHGAFEDQASDADAVGRIEDSPGR